MFFGFALFQSVLRLVATIGTGVELCAVYVASKQLLDEVFQGELY